MQIKSGNTINQLTNHRLKKRISKYQAMPPKTKKTITSRRHSLYTIDLNYHCLFIYLCILLHYPSTNYKYPSNISRRYFRTFSIHHFDAANLLALIKVRVQGGGGMSFVELMFIFIWYRERRKAQKDGKPRTATVSCTHIQKWINIESTLTQKHESSKPRPSLLTHWRA